ncbi:malonyl-CoA decarboxylase [Blastocladiella britannica]|nr:malonyl-CoA decarboxylase [Blastocladiella britannica]
MGSALAVLKRQIQTTLLPALELSEVTRASDPRLLRAVLQYETVHPLSSLDDLHRRLLPSRRIVALTHPHLVDPLAILQIALSPGPDPPGSIQALLSDPHAGADPAEPTAPAATATFYSVNSTMRGLSGIDMGTRIIKMGVTWIQAEWPSVRTFSTLSPIPTFKAWAMAHWDRADVLREVPPSTRALVVRTFGSWERFRSVVARGKWAADPAQQRFVKEVMQPVCKAYLENVRRDPVFRFHLGNGAIAWRLNFLGDTSVKGMHQSLSFMVNYLYDLDHLDENARAFRSPHRIVKSRL